MINPSEILVSKKQKDVLIPIIEKFFNSARVTKVDEWIFSYEYAEELLLNQFQTKTLKGFGVEEMNKAVIASGVIMNYLKETQKAHLTHINKLSLFNPTDYMLLDFSTKRNLEITFTMQEGEREGSLISILIELKLLWVEDF